MAEEKDSISYGYGEGNQNMAKYSRTPNATPSFQVPVELSEEEKAVLRECRVNSLYFRGIPLGIASVIITRYLGHNYAPHLKRWSGFYYAGAFGLGILVGIASYRTKCFEKIMALDNSRLGDQVREFQRRMGQLGPKKESEFDDHSDRQLAQEAALSNRTDMHQDDIHYQDSIHLGFPNQQRSINLLEADDEKATKEIGVSYEDLRRRHRAGLQTQRQPIQKPKDDALESQAKPDFRYNPDISYDRQETYSSSRLWDVDDNSRRSHESDETSVKGIARRGRKEPIRRNKYGDPIE